MIRPKIAGNGRGLATSGGGGSASSVPGSPSPPRVSTSGTSTMPSVRPKAGHRLGLKGKEGYGFSSRSNHGRYRIGRRGDSFKESRTGLRKWDPKVRKIRRTPRKYYRYCMGEGTRKVGSIGRIIRRVSSLNRRDRGESLGKGKNRSSE